MSLDGLSMKTDEKFLEEALKGYGSIKDIEVLKTPTKESSKDDQVIEFHVRQTL